MNTLTLAAFPVLAAAIISTQDPAPIEPASDVEIVAPVSSVRESTRVGTGLGPDRALQTGGLDMGKGLQSAARGLTLDAEWRAIFPVKPGTR